MTLKPNYLLAFTKTFLLVFVLVALISGVVPYFEGKKVQMSDVIGIAALGGAFLAIFVTVVFTPREISWNDETIKIRALFPGSGNFEWRELEAWCPRTYGRGVFLIKFENRQTFQISPAGFQSKEWKNFCSLLEQRFPEKKTLSWFGVRPIR